MNQSKLAYLICSILVIYSSLFFYPKWEKGGTEATISWDASGYYWYLPSAFIYQDLKHQGFKDSILNKYSPTPPNDFQQGFLHSSGNYVVKYAAGMAVMELPFFFAGHLSAKLLNYPQDGFSKPYQLALQLGGLLMALIGLWYFRKLLLLYFSDGITSVTLLLLVFGSNYLNYAAIEAAMTHSWLFTLYVFLLLNTHYFYKRFQLKYALRIGFLVGLATLTRPTDIAACLIPLLWGMEKISIKEIEERIALYWKHWKILMLAGFVAIAVISIQLFYWKYASGDWFVYSYGDQGFSWKNPNFYLFSFSAWNGWLAYSPLLIIAWIGIFPYLKNGVNKVMVISFFLIYFYIASAWDIWFYGGRAMIQSYPVAFFLIAHFIKFISSRPILKFISAPVILAFTYVNIWFTYQAHGGGLYDGNASTSAYYWRTIGRVGASSEVEKLKDTDELFEGKPRNMRIIYSNDFEKDSMYCNDYTIQGSKSICLDKDKEYTPAIIVTSQSAAKWLRFKATFHCPQKEWDMWKMAQMNIQFLLDGKIIKQNMIRVHRFLNDGETKALYIDARIPPKYTEIKIFFWNAGSDKLLIIDNVSLSTFN